MFRWNSCFSPLVRSRILSVVFSSCQTVYVHGFEGLALERGLCAGGGIYWLDINLGLRLLWGLFFYFTNPSFKSLWNNLMIPLMIINDLQWQIRLSAKRLLFFIVMINGSAQVWSHMKSHINTLPCSDPSYGPSSTRFQNKCMYHWDAEITKIYTIAGAGVVPLLSKRAAGNNKTWIWINEFAVCHLM